jgi:chaperonin GroES
VNLRPLGDRLVVEHVEQADNGKKLAMDVKVGDRIIYSRYSGSEIKIDGKDFLVISEKDVLGVFADAKVPAGVH